MWAGSAVAQLGQGAGVQAPLVGVALSPGLLLGMHVGGLAAIAGALALGDHRLVGVLAALAGPRPIHIGAGVGGEGLCAHGNDGLPAALAGFIL